MHKITLLLLAAVLLVGGLLLVPGLFSSDEPPLVRWSADDELEVPDEAAAAEAADALAQDGAVDRTAVDVSPVAADGGGARVDAVLRGRIVDKFRAPVPAAKVWLDFGRGDQRGGPQGRQRRVPDPVITDSDGRFAFQGQAYRNLRVSLQVAHPKHAVGIFDKNLGAIGAEVDLGDLALTQGGSVTGRVTDLDGNGVAGAAVQVQPENGNPLRFVRDRDKLIADVATDNNGFFRLQHAAAGDWSVRVTAKRHTEGRSPTFAVEEEAVVDLDDIRLGPGYEVTGFVRDTRGQPIAKATVTLRGRIEWSQFERGQGNRGPGARGGMNGRVFGGGDHTATTDDQGRFFLEHLPSTPMTLDASADGYLDGRQEPIDPTLGQPIVVTLQDGLRIAGRVLDGSDQSPVSLFAVRAVRLRGLPVAGAAAADWNQIMTRMRDGNLGDEERQQLRLQMESMRAQMGDMRRGMPQQAPNGGRGAREAGEPERHPNGEFVLTGLQEGVYEVHVESPDHTRYRSQELELRLNAAPATLSIALDRGFYVAGVVRDERGSPVRDARVELRPAASNDGPARTGRGGRGQRGGDAGQGGDMEAMARAFAQQVRNFQQTLEARTDGEGGFVIKHAAPGSYRLSASARGFSDATGETFVLAADSSGQVLELGLLGAIVGTVRGIRAEEVAEARVGAIVLPSAQAGQGGGMGALMRGRGPGGGGPFRTAEVSPDGSYRITDLAPGSYVVRSWIGSPQELMRELGPQMFDGSLTADVQVKGGEDSKLDVTLVRPQVGAVEGSVLHNGEPAKGFQIELTRESDGGAQPANGGSGRGFMNFGRTMQGAVANSGRFSIKNVPAGDYRLRVRAGGRRGGVLHEEVLAVAADTVVERSIAVTTSTLEGTVSDDGTGTIAQLRGNVTLVPGLTELPENFNQWRRQQGNSTFDARIDGGRFRFDMLRPDNYLLVLTLDGRERTTTTVVVGAGSTQVSATPGKPRTDANGSSPAPTPRNR